MLAHLLITTGPNKGLVLPLSDGQPLIIGRGRQTASRLLDPHVSRQHCQIVATGSSIVVTDLNSVGGTFLNGERITEAQVHAGDQVRVGETTLTLQIGDMADQVTLAPDVGLPHPIAEAPPPRTLPLPRKAQPAPHPAPPPSSSKVKPLVQPLLPTTVPMPAPEPPSRPVKPARPAAPTAKKKLAPPPAEPAPTAKKKSAPPPEEPAEEDEIETGTPPARLPSSRLAELVGTTLGHFQIESVIAKGQSGYVFKAKDLKQKRPVALKVLWPESSSNDTDVQRFVRSMRTMLPLRHPNIVSLYGAGRKGGFCWVAMEYVDGESLHQMILKIGTAGMLDWRHAFRIGVHLGRALEYAQAHSVIHRNLTPRNVLIRAADRMTLLGDLMLARALEGSLAESLTKPGEMLGDIRFMSPERTQGTEEVDHRSDLYSLGALLYTLLTGQPPFEGYSIVETVTMIRQKRPELPKKYQLSIPTRFQDTVLTLLAKRPESRFQTAAELQKDLAKIAKYLDVKV